jgi:hypothetical protein
VVILSISLNIASFAENIDPHNDESQYAYSENAGWLNAEPVGNGGPGIEVENFKLTGYVWSHNFGWISLSCENNKSCGSVDYGVTNDGDGKLSEYAWAENIGWISFSCENTYSCNSVDYGVTIDPLTGEFMGHAWGENIGWINFRSTGPVSYGVTTSWSSFVDDCEVDFEPDGDVDGVDLATLIDSGSINIDIFAEDFGRVNCP